MDSKRKKRIVIIIIFLIILSVLIGVLIGVMQKNNKIKSKKDINKERLEGGVYIRYAYSYNIPTADTLNEMSDYIDILKIELTANEVEKLQNIIDNISFEAVKENLEHPHTTAVIGIYELVLNKDEKILMDEKYALYTKGGDTYLIEISKDLFEYIEKKVNNELEKSIININTDEIIIYNNKEKKPVNIKDKDILQKLIDNYKYSKVKIDDDFREFDEFSNVVDFNNGIKVYIYDSSILGYEIDENNNTERYISFMGNYEDLVSNIYENYSNNLVEEFSADELSVNYRGKKYKIQNMEDVEKLLNSFKIFNYATSDWLDDFSESDYGDEDIVMEINDSKFIIPGNRNIGNRYFIDSKGKVYLVSYLGDLNIEKYLKELVKYYEE